MKKNLTWAILSICVILLCLLIVFMGKFSFPSSDISDGIVTIISVFIGILITMSITYILLNDQSQAESLKERNVKKFEKKQETYHSFLRELGIIVKNLTQRSLSGNEKTPYENITSLEELIVQFGYLRIHMDDRKFLDIIKKVTEIINVYKQKNLWENYKQDIVLDKKSRSNAVNQRLHELSFKLTMNLFEIARILNNDMYRAGKSDTNTLTNPITTQIQELLSIAFQVKEIDSLES